MAKATIPTSIFCDQCGKGFSSQQGCYQHFNKTHRSSAGSDPRNQANAPDDTVIFEMTCELCGNFRTQFRQILEHHQTRVCSSLKPRASPPSEETSSKRRRPNSTVWMMDDRIIGAKGLTASHEHLNLTQRRELCWATAVMESGVSLPTAQRFINLADRVTFQPQEEVKPVMVKIKTVMSRLKNPGSRFYPSTPWDRHITRVSFT
jgi:predicted DCC family thiol-disulfide oxidoreductase YuxK